MEFVGNKKTACFCGAPNCSGLIGEKPKEPEKLVTIKKKKTKRRLPSIKINLSHQSVDKSIVSEDLTRDPFIAMLEKIKIRIVDC